MTEAVTPALRGFLDISPVRREDANKENETPVLSLIQFSKPPFVTFGSVKLGSSKSVVLLVENPTEDVDAEVIIDKIPSGKGFSVDYNTFEIQPGGSFRLTVTWTPSEEGGIRELIVFNANGVLKHQAILLGRAEAPKKKKKSLWDTIKNKREGEKVGAPRKKKTVSPLKMAANKTFQVARKPQYKRDKLRSPLASLNSGRTVRERSVTKNVLVDASSLESGESKGLNPKQRLQSLALSHQETVHHVQKNSPVVLLVPTTKFRDSGNMSASPDTLAEKPENKDLTRMLNRTLSPVGTPERFKKLMPHIKSESPLSAAIKSAGVDGAPALSLKDALALIDSDLSRINTSPRDTSSSCEFSDSLESKGEKLVCESDEDALKALPDSPELPESKEQRLTFFISKKTKEKVTGEVKKASFTSVTVTKIKAPVEVISSGGRKIKKSRRRLLEKTLELSESCSPCESGPDTPSLPVIDVDAGATVRDDGHRIPEFTSSSPAPRLDGSPTPVIFPVSSSPRVVPFHFSPSITSPPPSFPATLTSTITSPIAGQPPTHGAPPSVQEDSFPVHVTVKNKKRKSEEGLKPDGKIEDGWKSEQVKRSRVVPAKTESLRSVRKKNAPQRQGATGSTPSVTSSSALRTTRSVALAQAKQPSSKSISQGASSLRAYGAKSVKAAKLVAVAQSKLTFIKPTQTALPRHPMPFAAKNMFYDERWIEKQERGFTWWINYVLTPDDFKVNTEVAKVSAVSLAMGNDDKFSVPKAPTKEEMSFSTYTAKRKLNRLRRSACQLFTSEVMVKAIQRLELEVEAQRLLIRKDRHLWKDIGERKKVLNWLLSYNPLWLRIGLETIFGELISLESNSDALGLAMFILQRLLWNPDIAAEFRHPRVPHLYKEGHEEALSRFTLKKLLLLVCFLDKAKESRLIEHDPCLFCVDADFKATKDLLLAFSRDFLSGEGILPRHLSYLGLPVSHVQTPLDEFDFAVKNLAVDLKCGIRLVRVMELLVQDWSYSAKLRLPAISRLQKVHNVDVALQVLKGKGVDLKDERGSIIDSRDIVDGHRERTLSLLWKIIFAFHVEVILDEDQLREEIGFLKKTLRTKRRLASVRADRGIQPSPAKSRVPYEHTSTKIALLMDWARAVCDFYNLKVENFTVTFSDGRVLCYLIHHYHPSLLPGASISHCTTQTMECSPRGRLELSSNSDSSFDSSPSGPNGSNSPSVEFKELLENEKNNFRLVNSAVAFLGGVPAMINPADMSNTIPNEKVVMSYLSFLCARLLDLRNETRAARVIQGALRKYRLKKDLQLYEERNKAAVKIQVVVKRFLQRRRAKRQNLAAVLIQSAWRGYLARNRLRLKKEAELRAMQHQAATVIQAQWRMFSTLRAYQRLRYYTIVIQAQWRMRKAAAAYGKIYRAVRIIQKYSRAWTLSRRDRERYLHLRAAVVKLQRSYRSWKAQKTHKANRAAKVIQNAFRRWYKKRMAERNNAAVRIQSWIRMQLCFHRYRKLKRSAVLIQAQHRGHAQRRHFQMLKLQHHSAVVIQSAFRGYNVRKLELKRKWAAVTIQRWYRASVARDMERKKFVRMRRAAVSIQAVYRGKTVREKLKKQHLAATAIQTAFRKYTSQKVFVTLKKATTLIQQKYRAAVKARKAKEEFDAVRKAVLVVQANWRGRADRKRIQMWHRSATLIQACYRRHKAQAEYRCQMAAAVVIQHQFRAFAAGKEMRRAYLQKKAACVALQAGFRGMRVRTELRKRHEAATTIQSVVRMFLCRKAYLLLHSAVIITQSRYRALLHCRAQQQEFRKLKWAAIKIQAVFRGFRVRRDLRKRHSAARAIQAQFRMHRIRVAYLATKCAAIIIQQRYRAKMLRDEQMQRYRAVKSAAVVIQAAYRGHKDRRMVAEMHGAASVIQRRFLSIHTRKQFLAIKAAALVCQRRYRAATLARACLVAYQSKRRAAIYLQAAYRGYSVRKQQHVRHMAAATIQSHFRKYLQRRNYKRLQWACSVLQTHYRANRKMRAEVHALHVKKQAAAVLQAAFRRMKSRQLIRERHQAATVIQRAYRAHHERILYLTLKSAVLKVQHRYRANVAAKEQRKRYEQTRRAAVVLQAAYRGQQVRKEVVRWHQAATVIQSAFRQHREEVKFQAMRLSAIIIQRRYRASVLQKLERQNFLKMRRSAVVLQAAFRGHRLRTKITNMHRAATVIQANFKRRKQQLAFRRQCWAACVLQQRFRAQKLKQLEVNRYQEFRKAAAVLQAVYRGMKSRQLIRQKHQAATLIQRAYRAHHERILYLSLKSAVVKVQHRYRANVAAKEQRKRYEQTRRAAVVLQAAYRGQQVRKEVVRWHQAATVIQSAFRQHREEVKFQAMRLSAIIIQRRYRALLLQRQERGKFLKMRRSAVVLQAAFRGHRLRTEITNMHRAATVIQANFKRRKQQLAFRRQCWAACVLQQRFRAQKLKQLEVNRYQEVRKAAAVLQAVYRGMKSRQMIRRRHQAATVIQRAYRAHCEHRKYLTLKSAILILQRRYRASVQGKKQMQRYRKVRDAAVVLQAAYRGQQVRNEVVRWHQAATVIQSAFRKHREEVKFQAMRLSAIIIQRLYRTLLLQKQERGKFLKMRRSAVVLQAAYRGMKSRQLIRERHQAATVIQRAYRAHHERILYLSLKSVVVKVQHRYRANVAAKEQRKRYEQTRRAAVVLQAAYRGQQVRKEVVRWHQAATVIQSAFRQHREEVKFQAMRLSAIIIQRRYRASVLQRLERQNFLKMRRSAVVLQAAFRGHRLRTEITNMHRAATVIQANFKRRKQQLAFRRQCWAACVLQQRFRAQKLKQLEVNRYQEVRKAAAVLQAVYRGMKSRQMIRRRHQAATVIQRAYRAHCEHRKYLTLKSAILILQRRYRASVAAKAERNHYTKLRQAAITLQRCCRVWRAHQQSLKAARAQRTLRFTAAVFHHLCAMKIQRALKAHWALESAKRQIHSVITIQRWLRAKQQRRLYLEDRRKVVTAQRAVRGWLARRQKAASVIQMAVRKFLHLRHQKRVQQGIVKAQALWRGHRSRRLNDNPKLVKLRHRLHQVSARVREEDKLCNKTSSALDYLLRYKHFSYILEALKNLETATRLSPECCERLVESGATNVIFTLIRCCNRSVPCMDVITFSIQILLNLSKYHKTIEAVYSVENSVETLLDLLQRYREKAGDKVAEKGGSIFTKACFLLALLLQDKHRTQEVIKLPKALDRIRSIYRLTARKHKMDAERTIVKQKMNASINGSFFIAATPRKSRPAPKFAPDWVLRKDKLKDIVDPLRAIQMVADALSIVL